MIHTFPKLKLAAVLAAVACVLQISAAPVLFGQAVSGIEQVPETDPPLEIDPTLLEEPWADPIERFGLEAEPLAATPDFDFRTLHASTAFEAGVESVPVQEPADVSQESERHLRALQAVATAEQSIETTHQDIDAADIAIVAATNRIAEAREETADLERRLARSELTIVEIEAADLAEVDEQDHLTSEINAINAVLVELALEAFTGEDDDFESFLADPGPIDNRRVQVLTDEVRERQRGDIDALEGLIHESDQRRAVLARELATAKAISAGLRQDISVLNAEVADLTDEIAYLREAIAQLEERLAWLETALEETTEFTSVTAVQFQLAYANRLTSFVQGTDIPLVALNAYVRAERTLGIRDPGCGIHWSQLAGIGRIESRHGYFGDSTLDIDGNTTDPIRGLALDGRVLSGAPNVHTPDPTERTEETNGVKRLALIRDTDGGVLDGDLIYDRAVGPMQFIPSTWRLFDADGNSDGETNPQNVYDAALAAAQYLCDASGSMRTHKSEQRGYFAYNHDLDYSRDVTNAGRRYQRQLKVSPESGSFAAFAALAVPAELFVPAATEENPIDESDITDLQEDSNEEASEVSETATEPTADETVTDETLADETGDDEPGDE